jgi:hypothetical protein
MHKEVYNLAMIKNVQDTNQIRDSKSPEIYLNVAQGSFYGAGFSKNCLILFGGNVWIG